jgi:hypothetical protein
VNDVSQNQHLRPAKHRGIGRRTFLRGVGVTMALPWLESLPVWGAETSVATGAAATMPLAAFPKRFGVLFMGNGISPPSWSSKGNGTEMVLGKTLSPLEPLKSKINVINGLYNKVGRGNGIHPAQTGNLLTGVPITKGALIHSGVSVDQVLAKHVGQDTRLPSMVLACEQPLNGYHESNFSCAYSSHISWQSPDSPMPNELYPSLAFDALFENRGNLRNISILDRLKGHAEDLSRQVSSSDKAKLDEYLTSVREIERGVERMRVDKDKADERAKALGQPTITMKRPENGLPNDFREHAKLMCDIIALAFQTDKTRIATLLLARDLSTLYYPFLNVTSGHHDASHQENGDGYESISRMHLGQVAYLAQKLDAMQEGEGTVLDNSCLMFLSNMWSGHNHDNTKVPMVLIGGLGGTLQTGRSLDYIDAGDENRQLCSLYLGIMDRMGVKLDYFGDADTRLANF